jgi:hypothetical protein
VKDPFGHGSVGSSHRADFARNKIGMGSDANFSRDGARNTDKNGAQHVAALRKRLTTPKHGLAHSFMQKMKDALS